MKGHLTGPFKENKWEYRIICFYCMCWNNKSTKLWLQICFYVNKMCWESQQHEYALTTIKSVAK